MVALDQYMMTELMMRALVMTMLCAPEIACLVLSVCALSPSPPLGASSPSHIFCQITQFKEHPHHPPHDHDCQYHLQHNHIHIITRLGSPTAMNVIPVASGLGNLTITRPSRCQSSYHRVILRREMILGKLPPQADCNFSTVLHISQQTNTKDKTNRVFHTF